MHKKIQLVLTLAILLVSTLVFSQDNEFNGKSKCTYTCPSGTVSCTAIFQPVCAIKDGKSTVYSNRCVAECQEGAVCCNDIPEPTNYTSGDSCTCQTPHTCSCPEYP